MSSRGNFRHDCTRSATDEADIDHKRFATSSSVKSCVDLRRHDSDHAAFLCVDLKKGRVSCFGIADRNDALVMAGDATSATESSTLHDSWLHDQSEESDSNAGSLPELLPMSKRPDISSLTFLKSVDLNSVRSVKMWR